MDVDCIQRLDYSPPTTAVMSLKRKLSLEFTTEQARIVRFPHIHSHPTYVTDITSQVTKRPNLLPYPNEDTDVVMSEPFHDETQEALNASESEDACKPLSAGKQRLTNITIPSTYSEYSSAENSPTSSRAYL